MSTQDDILDLEKKVLAKEEKLERQYQEIEKLRSEYIEKLEKVAKLTADNAKSELLAEVEKREAEALSRIISEKEEAIKAEANQKAKEILADAMRHGKTEYVAEYTVSVIELENDEMKGRIIGQGGRNIRAFENATGVDVLLEEEKVIRLSSFDQIRREVAKRSLMKLLKDARITPVRIEEIVAQTREEMERVMLEEGENLAKEVGVYKVPVDLLKILGRFKFRTSYGQNLVIHSFEVAKIAVAIAEEIGADVNVVRLAGLFHDIGKVVEGDGSHVKLGVDLLQKFNFPQPVIDCVAQHHEDTPFTSVESVIMHVADAISAARPGARHQDVEGYVQRVKDMESLAKQFDGVMDAYAFESGRELRVIVAPEHMRDDECIILANKLREEMTKKMAIPGEVKVTVIREFRASAGGNTSA